LHPERLLLGLRMPASLPPKKTPLKIVLCLDSWKGSLTSAEACAAVARGLRGAVPGVDLLSIPMADGGEGTLDAVEARDPGLRIGLDVCGPLPGSRVRGEYLLWTERREALIEMAVCAGLPLLTEAERDPMRTTTFGVGQMVADAVKRGAQHIHLAVGGSATVDGGAGMASALGWRFLDAAGNPLPLGGGALQNLERILPPENPSPGPLAVRVWCDVINPLTGPKGAAAVFAPQKGASPEQVLVLEAGLCRLAEITLRDLGVDIATPPGTGAAGGLSAGAIAFLNARLVSGVETLAQKLDLENALRGADWVVTGEGRFDAQSLDGKVVSGILGVARKTGAKVAVLAGSIALGEEALRAAGVDAAVSANPGGLPLAEALRRAPELAEAAARRLGANF